MPIDVGKVVDGTVINITNFGAFIQLPEGKTGLVHISEVADQYVKDIRDYLKEKDQVKVKVLSIDNNGKISLSIKKAAEGHKSSKPAGMEWGHNKNLNMSFEDRLAKYLKDSDEKQQQLKKNQDSKRKSGGGFRNKSFDR